MIYNILSIFNRICILTVRSPNWKKVRDKYLKNHPLCEICGSNTKLHVHHIIPVHVDKNKELEEDNLITLCGQHCHFVFGHLMSWRSYNSNVRADAEFFKSKILNRP